MRGGTGHWECPSRPPQKGALSVRSSPVRHRFVVLGNAALILTLFFSLACLGIVAADPTGGDGFSYSFHRHVGSGSGAYDGYTDNTYSSGQYHILTTNASQVTFRATYSWTYSSSEGLRQSSSVDRTVSFSLPGRHYVARLTDLDDYDSFDGTTLAVWFWVSPGVRPGDTVQILENNFTVVAMDATTWSQWVPRRGIAATAAGTGIRNDAYGQFSLTWLDTYYFDAATGYAIAERYQEHDTGFFQGQSASFDWTESFDVMGTTYPILLDLPVLGGTIASIGVMVVSTSGVAYGARWRMRTVGRSRYVDSTTEVYRLWEVEDFPRLLAAVSPVLAPFLEDFARKAALSKDTTAIAVAGTRIVGFGMNNREAKIATILGENTVITETLRSFLRAKDFFTDTRHVIPEGLRSEALGYGVTISESNAYNVFETYQVVRRELDGGPIPSYDVTLVSRMAERDLPEVSLLARRVYRVPSERWLRSVFDSGDLAFVARVGGKIVGFAFASLANGHGRIHTLTVLPEYRNSGIGKELMRARLAALRTLEATDVIAEIADWNLPSLQVAWRHGFQPVGKMFVETARTSRIQRTIVRR